MAVKLIKIIHRVVNNQYWSYYAQKTVFFHSYHAQLSVVNTLLFLLLTLFILPAHAESKVQNAWMAVTEHGSYLRPSNTLEQRQLPTNWQAITYPHTTPRQISTLSAEHPPLVTYWFKFNVSSETANQVTNAKDTTYDNSPSIYIPRWQTIGKIAIYVDEQLVHVSKTGPVWNGFNHPLLIKLGEPRQKEYEVIIRVDSLKSAGLAISNIYTGPVDELHSSYSWRTILQTRFPEIANSAFLLIGFFSLALWSRHRNESIYLLFFVVAVFSYLRCLQYYIGIEPLVISENWFSWLNVISSGWLVIFTYAFCFRLHGIRFKKIETALLVAMAFISLITIPNLGVTKDLGTILSFANLLIFIELILLTILMTFASWKSRSVDGLRLSTAHFFNIPLGIHDVLLQNYQLSMENIYLLPYTILAPLFVLITVVNRRYTSAMTEIANANKTLEVKLKQREEELTATHELIRKAEKEKLLADERQRLMSDMHDGFGSSLITALAMIKHSDLDKTQVSEIIQDCIDDLKLTIDSMEPIDADLLLVLAMLRYRLEPKLQQSGIQLDWQVESIPPMEWLRPESALQILRIIQEAFTNIIKHAQATHVVLKCTCSKNCVSVCIEDNGIGIDLEKARLNRGILNMRRRAEQLGATISWKSNTQSTGTFVRLELPVIKS